MKRVQVRARTTVFAMSIAGALAAAVASQLPANDGATSPLHAYVASVSALLLGVAALVTRSFLGHDKTVAWTRARAAAEALKQEAFRYAATGAPYFGLSAEQASTLLDERRGEIERAAAEVAQPAADACRAGSSPRAALTPNRYRSDRVLAQAEFYRLNGIRFAKVARRLRILEFALAVVATAVTAGAAVVGKKVVFEVFSFDLAALTAVLTTLSGAVVSHIEASRFDYLAETYLASARRLEDLALRYDNAACDPAAWARFVQQCEEIITAENASWVVKWSTDKR